MFDALSDRLGGIFDGLTGRGALSEKDVNAALREIRVALLEADVALPVVKDFIDSVRTRAVGEEVVRSVKPGQQVVKIVYDGLVEMLGGTETESGLRVDNPPATAQTRVDRLARRAPPRGHAAIGDPCRPVRRECLFPAHHRRPAAGRYRPARRAGGEDRRL